MYLLTMASFAVAGHTDTSAGRTDFFKSSKTFFAGPLRISISFRMNAQNQHIVAGTELNCTTANMEYAGTIRASHSDVVAGFHGRGFQEHGDRVGGASVLLN